MGLIESKEKKKRRQSAVAIRKAASEGHTDKIEEIIDKTNAETKKEKNIVDVRDFELFKKSPLHKAAETGKLDACKLLISKGASVDAQDKDGTTPLHEASGSGNTEIVELLLKEGATIEAIDAAGWTPLHTAAKFGHEEVIKVLLKNGANVEATDMKYRWTPLMRACINGNDEAVEALLANGANRAAVANDGSTAKDYAIQRGFGPMGM